MRTIKNLPVPQNPDNVNFPHGGILNETISEQGTPIVEEIYGDIISNIYKILAVTEEVPNENQDKESTSYQLVNALKKFANELNDVQQVLSLAGTVWGVNMNLNILPDKYIFFAIAAEAYDANQVYTFKGSGAAPIYSFSSDGFEASDELLIIIDQAGVKAINLKGTGVAKSTVLTPLAEPLAFNSSKTIVYDVNGKYLTDKPEIYDLRNHIRTLSTDPLAEVYDMVILKGYVLCFVYLPGTITYKFYQFDLNDLNTAINVPISGIVIPIGSDNQPYLYTDGNDIYITNAVGTTADDEDISKLAYDPAIPSITFSSTITISPNFVKTSNVIVKAGELFTFINSVLKKYNLANGVETIINNFEAVSGQIFQFDANVYYSNGEVANKWEI